MTDNSIFECAYFMPPNQCNNQNNKTYECDKYKSCYFKELKAKEQECEELKKIINEAKNSKLDLKSFLVGEAVQNEYEQQLDQLKAENEDLKKWKEKVIDLFNRTCRCKYLNEETAICGLNNKKCISINECMYRKQQTLTEIKEIAKEKANVNDWLNLWLSDVYRFTNLYSEVENE